MLADIVPAKVVRNSTMYAKVQTENKNFVDDLAKKSTEKQGVKVSGAEVVDHIISTYRETHVSKKKSSKKSRKKTKKKQSKKR